MKHWRYSILLILTGFPAWLLAQLQPVASSIHTLTARINLVEDQVKITGDSLTVLQGGSAFETEMLLDSLAIESGELAIYYHLPQRKKERGLDKREVQFTYTVTLGLILNGEPIVPEPQYLLGDMGAGLSLSGKDNQFRIQWAHILQDFVNIEGELKVSLKVEEYTNLLVLLELNCQEAPSFNFEQRLPYFLAAGAGAGLIVLGIAEEMRSQDIYDNEYAKSGSLRQALPLYNKANNKHHNYIIFTTAGTVILLTDAVLYFRRSRRYKKGKNIYDQYCPEKPLSLNPVFELPSGSPAGGQLGLRITYSF